MKTLLASIVLLFFVDARACQVRLPERVVVSGAIGSFCAFDQKDCAPEDIRSLCDLLQAQNGALPLQRLQAVVGERVSLLSPSGLIRVQRLANLIKSNFPIGDDVEMELTGGADGDYISMSASSEVSVKCHPCSFNGNEVLRLQVRQFGEQPRDFSFSAKFALQVFAYRAKGTINAFATGLNQDQFERVKVPQVSYGRYLTDLGKITYFKPNKTIRAGEILRETDLAPLTLVRAGDKVDLLFENKHVRLRSHATSRQNGGMGDKIEVRNQANGKKYRGIITDHNRVVVEL